MAKIKRRYISIPALVILGISLVWFVMGDEQKFDIKTIRAIEYDGSNILVLKPRFTEAAYSKGGFYDYYAGKCDEKCLSIPLNEGAPNKWGAYNKRMVSALESLGYPMVDDSEINPAILEHYDTLIILHNEYVTKELYQAITQHKNVIYMYPNALYAEVKYENDMMSLVRGHGYPDVLIGNGFGWEHDNTHPYEYDTECESWKFIEVSNGWQLNCTPELSFYEKPEILYKMKLLS